MSTLYKYFKDSKLFSTKYKNYFSVYEILFNKYKNKRITFVEIGVLDGGSLLMWKKYFGKNAKIIGIDLNPKAKKFEKNGIDIQIGSQSDENFWNKFFQKNGKIDILLDDGGHTNKQQIITTNNVKNIKDNGMIVIEDAHTSYQKEFGNPSKYSFINYSKKIIDDINHRFNMKDNFKFSLNKYIYSAYFFESVVCFNINRKLCKKNQILKNKGRKSNHFDYRYNNQIKKKRYYHYIFKNNVFLKIYIKLKDTFFYRHKTISKFFK